jgi:membrane protein
MAIKRILHLLNKTAMKWWDDNPWRLSAALSYYTLFSLAPLFTIAVAVATVVVEESIVQDQLLRQFEDLIGQPGATAIIKMLQSAGDPVHGTVAALISLITLCVVSMGMFSELQDALNLIWRVPVQPGSTLWRGVKSRLFSFLLVLCTGFLLLASLLMSAVVSAAERFIHRELPWPYVITAVIDVSSSPVVITVLFALLFKFLPEGHIAWRDVWVSAPATAMQFSIGKWVLGHYLGGAAMASMYGAASSLMVILAWVYYSALIFFLGAELTYVYAYHYGSRLNEAEPSATRRWLA